MIQGRTHTVGEAMTIERASLRPLAPEPFDLQEVSFPKVDGAGCVRVKTNPYSVGSEGQLRVRRGSVST